MNFLRTLGRLAVAIVLWTLMSLLIITDPRYDEPNTRRLPRSVFWTCTLLLIGFCFGIATATGLDEAYGISIWITGPVLYCIEGAIFLAMYRYSQGFKELTRHFEVAVRA